MIILILFTNLIYLSSSFINYERDICFVNKYTFILSNEEMYKIRIVHLDELYNFVVKNIFI
jgi:hypothetical protein